jgi:dephospho-CoA kinase
MCPKCASFKFPDLSFRGHDDRVNIDKKVLGSFLLKNDKARHKLEDVVFEELSKEIERNESQFNPCNIIVDGLVPRFLKKIKFDYVLYVHTEEKERIKRLKGRGVSPKRIKEIMNVQEEMFRSPICFFDKWE